MSRNCKNIALLHNKHNRTALFVLKGRPFEDGPWCCCVFGLDERLHQLGKLCVGGVIIWGIGDL